MRMVAARTSRQRERTGKEDLSPGLVLASLRTCRGRLAMGVSGLAGWVLKRTGPWSSYHRSSTRHQGTEKDRPGPLAKWMGMVEARRRTGGSPAPFLASLREACDGGEGLGGPVVVQFEDVSREPCDGSERVGG